MTARRGPRKYRGRGVSVSDVADRFAESTNRVTASAARVAAPLLRSARQAVEGRDSGAGRKRPGSPREGGGNRGGFRSLGTLGNLSPMPGQDSLDDGRDRRLTNGLFWGGVGLAPVAAILLLLGQEGGSLRFAAVLAILAIVLIGLSVTMRSNSDTTRAELEDLLYEEIDALRSDVRDDIGGATRSSNKALGEQIQALSAQVNALRADMDAVRPDDRGGYDRYPAGPAPRPRAALSGPPPANPPGRRAAPNGAVPASRHTIIEPVRDDRAVYGADGYGRHSGSDDDGWSQRARGDGRRGRDIDDDPRYEDGWSAERDGDRWDSGYDDDRDARPAGRRSAYDDEPVADERTDRWAGPRDDAPRRDDDWRGAEHDDWRADERGGRRTRNGWRDDRDARRGEPEDWRADDRDTWRDEREPRDARRRDEANGWRGDRSGWRDDRDDDWRDGRRDLPDRPGDRDDWRDGSANWQQDRWAEPDDGPRVEAGWGRERRAVAALPAGNSQPSSIWDGEWSEPQRQFVGRRRRDEDEEPEYRYAREGDRRW